MTKYHQNLGAYLFIKLLLTFVSSTDKVLEILKLFETEDTNFGPISAKILRNTFAILF